MFKPITVVALALSIFSSSALARASELDLSVFQQNLKQHLTQLPTTPVDPLQVNLDASFEALNLRSDKREYGQLTTAVRTSSDGLQVSYPAAVIRLLNQGRSDDEPSETAFAMEYFDVAELVDLFQPRDAIIERITTGRLLRVVHLPNLNQFRFEYLLPLEALIDDEELRGYVNEFEANYHLTVTDDLHPVKAELNFYGDGSAYFFFDVKAAGQSIEHYAQQDGYLFVTESKSSQNFESTFSKRRFTTTFVANQIADSSNAEQHSTASLSADVPPYAVD